MKVFFDKIGFSVGRNARFLITTLVVAAVLFALFSVVREHLVPRNADFDRARWRLTGDEPAYLLTAQAIASGYGEDVSRVHAAGTYSNFQHRIVIGDTQWTWSDYKRLECPHWVDRSKSWNNTKQVIQRPPLIAVFAAPFALKQSHPRWSIIFAHDVFVTLTVFLLLILTVRRDHTVCFYAFACISVFGSMPVISYTAAIFPEVLMGCLLALAMMLWRRKEYHVRSLAVFPMILSLWGSGRVVPAVGIATMAMIYQEIRNRRFSIPVMLAAGWSIYIGYNFWLWGYPVPPAPANGGTLTLLRIPIGLLENFIGNDVGLFWLSPVATVGVGCCVSELIRHHDDPSVVPTALLIAGVAAVVASFSNPRAGTCPAGRYQVVQAIILLVPVLTFLEHEQPGSILRKVCLFVLFISGVVSLIMGITIAFHPGWGFEHYHPFFKIRGIQRYYRFLPDFQRYFQP